MALDDFSLDIAPEEIVSIVGLTGCGKSTALNLLAGSEQPSSGLMSVDGKAVNGRGHNRGVVFQQLSLLSWLTVLSNAVLGIKCRGVAPQEYESRALRLLEQVGLGGFERRYPYQLSGGLPA